MAEQLLFTRTADRTRVYAEILPQIESVISSESDYIANLANVAAMLKEAFGFFWVGFYRMHEGELVLGPFQGPLACTRIALARGVCGAAATQKITLVVPDVDQFPGHIACSSLARSEIVTPIMDRNGAVQLVLDVDSTALNDFSEADVKGMEAVAALIQKRHF